jgi:hypothetical protein
MECLAALTATSCDTAFAASGREVILSFNLPVSTRMTGAFLVWRDRKVIFGKKIVINSR